MQFPGTPLNPADFEYDEQGLKPLNVQQHEAQLVNNLYDIAQIAPHPNGATLPGQYSVALSNLVRPLNPARIEQITTVNKTLSRKLNHWLEDGSTQLMTVQDAYNDAFNRYEKADEHWRTMQDKKQAELHQEHPHNPKAMKEAYSRWINETAEAEQAIVRQRWHAISAIMPVDEYDKLMQMIESGGGGALEDALAGLQTMRHTAPNLAKYWPVAFEPDNWAKSLHTNFHPVDLLQSPEYLARKLEMKWVEVNDQLHELRDLQSAVPSPSALKDKFAALAGAHDAYGLAQTDQLKQYAQSAVTAAKIYLEKKKGNPGTGGKPDDPNKAKDFNQLNTALQAKGETGKGAGSTLLTPEDLNKLLAGQDKVIDCQYTLTDTAQKYADAGLAYAAAQSMDMDLSAQISDLLASVQDLEHQRQQMRTAAVMSESTCKKLHPTRVPEGYQKIEIQCNRADFEHHSDLKTTFEQTSWSVDLFFGSASGSSSKATSNFKDDVQHSKTLLEIGFFAMKVDINRPWFGKEVLGSTDDYVTRSAKKISHGVPPDLEQATLEEYNDAVLPAYPMALVIAKDITIKFSFSESDSHHVQSLLDKHSSVGGGFLCFGASHSSAEHHESKKFTSHVEGKNVVIRIPGTQVLGHYLEYTPEDESKPATGNDAEYNTAVLMQQLQTHNQSPAESPSESSQSSYDRYR